MAPATREGLQQDLLRTLAAWHAGAPDQPGLQPERLRLQLALRPPPASFRALLETLLRRGTVRQDGPWLRLTTHQIRLSAADERLWPDVRALLAAERFRPPRTRDLAQALSMPEPAMRAALKRLQRVGLLIEVAPDHFFLRETVAEMATIAAEAARNDPGSGNSRPHRSVTVSTMAGRWRSRFWNTSTASALPPAPVTYVLCGRIGWRCSVPPHLPHHEGWCLA